MSLRFWKYTDPEADLYWEQLEDWNGSLDPDRDEGERSYVLESSRAWFYEKNFNLSPDSHFGTYFGVDRNNHVVVQATLAVDDRDMRKKCNVPGEGMWGLVLTHHDHRQKGYGFAMCEFIDKLLQQRVNQNLVPETYSLFTRYEPAVKIYKRLGFAIVKDVLVDNPGLTGGGEPFTEQLMVKFYLPAPVASELREATAVA